MGTGAGPHVSATCVRSAPSEQCVPVTKLSRASEQCSLNDISRHITTQSTSIVEVPSQAALGTGDGGDFLVDWSSPKKRKLDVKVVATASPLSSKEPQRDASAYGEPRETVNMSPALLSNSNLKNSSNATGMNLESSEEACNTAACCADAARWLVGGVQNGAGPLPPLIFTPDKVETQSGRAHCPSVHTEVSVREGVCGRTPTPATGVLSALRLFMQQRSGRELPASST